MWVQQSACATVWQTILLKVSAKTGEGLEDLKQLLGKILSEEQIYVEKIFFFLSRLARSS